MASASHQYLPSTSQHRSHQRRLVEAIRELNIASFSSQPTVFSRPEAARQMGISVGTLKRFTRTGLVLTVPRRGRRGAGITRSEIKLFLEGGS